MSVRHYADHITTETGDEVRIEIHDSEFGGASTKLKGTGSGWFSQTQQKLNPRKPLENPILKSEVKASVWVRSSSLITDIFSSQEGRFTLIYDKNSSQEFEGYILPDLCTKTQYESDLWKLDIVAKDFSIFSGNYSMQTGRVTPISIIADILSDKFSLDITSHTSWIVDGTTTANDFLRQVDFDKFALRNYANTGDEEDTPISLLAALEKVLVACGCVIRQTEGKFYLQQVSALEDPTAVLESNYDSDGAFVSASNVDLTTTDKIVISPENGNPGVRSAKVTYDHRTKVTGIQYPELLVLDNDNVSSTKTQFLTSDGNQRIQLSAQVNAIGEETTATDGRIQYYIKVGTSNTYYLDPTESTGWATSINLLEETLQKGTSGDEVYFNGFISQLTPKIPADADGEIEIFIDRADYLVGGSFQPLESTNLINAKFELLNSVSGQDSTSITYLLTQSGNQSVDVTHPVLWFGDGPTDSSKGAISLTDSGTYTSDDWARRGEASFINHAHIVLREILDSQRTYRERISATVKSTISFIDIVSRDSKYYWNLGGTFDGFTGITNAELFEIDFTTGADTFEDILNFETSVSTGTGVTVASQLRDNKKFSNSQKITTTTSNLSGTITSIPIEAVGEQFLEPGNIFYLFNLSTASLTEFTLTNPQLASDTTLTVESTALTETIVSGSWVVFTGDQIGSYRTQSDTAIRLGVRDYAQAVTPQNDAYMMTVQTDELQSGATLTASDITDSGFTVNFSEPDFQTEDVPWAFATNGDQTALDQGLSSEIALLAGQIIIKTTGSGLAEVRLDSKASTGSLVQITADNIDLRGLVTAINDDPNSFTEIDGGKIKATSSIVVGTGENIAALSGEGTVRIYAGASDPDAAPYRVLNNGEVYGTKFVQLSGEDVDGVIENFSIKDLVVTGEVTNPDGDYVFDESGIRLINTAGSQVTGATVTFESDTNTNMEMYALAGGGGFIQTRDALILNAFNQSFMTIGSLGGSTERITIIEKTLNLGIFTTTERDNLTPLTGDLIYNSTTGDLEFYNGTAWTNT